MFSWNGLNLAATDEVYSPREDSILLAEAALNHAKGKVLDLGCGTGIVGLSAAKNKNVEEIVFADVSQKALALAEKNAAANKLYKPARFVQTDLFSDIEGEFDTITFNPPYLPTTGQEKVKGELNLALDGGRFGRDALDLFLMAFPDYLAPEGVLLLLNSSVSAEDGESGNRLTKEKLESSGFSVETLASKRFFFEELVIFKARKYPPSNLFFGGFKTT
ncbi:methyltransferase [Candidatus Micrarchaeota archaeon]|nr:methyltransferase [Candidatus Micrarchaeota archaeon]